MPAYMVSKIKFDEKFQLNIPVEYYQNYYLAKQYVRTKLFDCLEPTFNYVELNRPVTAMFDDCRYQPFDRSVTECDYDKTIATECRIFNSTGIVVCISDNDIADADYDVQQAIYEKLEDYLPVDFIILQQ